LQATGTTLDRGYKLEVLTGLLMIGHLDIDPEGKHLNGSIPKIPIGLGNGAHLATTDLRCIPGGLHDKAAPSDPHDKAGTIIAKGSTLSQEALGTRGKG